MTKIYLIIELLLFQFLLNSHIQKLAITNLITDKEMWTGKTGVWDLSSNIFMLKSVIFQLTCGKMDLSKKKKIKKLNISLGSCKQSAYFILLFSRAPWLIKKNDNFSFLHFFKYKEKW